MEHRVESDFLGAIQVPAQALYGAQTQRALDNFPVGSQRTIGSFATLVQALLLVKKAAATANYRSGALAEKRAQAILDAADQLLRQDPSIHFPIHYLHGGGGTSANMNANEVLANLGEEMLGGQRGQHERLHPNDHVNLNQSTNDVYPTACHIAIILQWPQLQDALQRLVATFDRKSDQFKDQRRIARTCLQDAVDTSYFDLFQGYGGVLRRGAERLEQAVERLYIVNLGGTIVGRQTDVPETYFRAIIPALREVTSDRKYQQADNLFDAAQNPDDVVDVSAQLALLARALIKIAKDFRLLASGPETGLGELELPAVQPGSSIMPGKVNPVIPEFLIQIGFKVIGNHSACAAGLDHGELDLNVWESSMVFAVLESMELLTVGLSVFCENCVRGLDVDAETNARHVESIIPLLTRLAQAHGYSTIAAICREAEGDLKKLRALIADRFEGDP